MNCLVEIRLVFRLEFMFKTVLKTLFETVFKTMLKTVFKNNKLYLIKTCHFLKLQIRRRETLYLMSFLRQGRTSNNNFYQNVQVSKHTIRTFKALQTSYGHTKRFKSRPCKRTPNREAMINLPKAVTFPQFPSITAYDEDGEEKCTCSYEIFPSNTCENLLPSPKQIRHFDCGIRMVSFTLETRKQK